MPNPTTTLTEKEREALRLLLAGHDAKSSARALDISHHTVNDRLRSARRKLGVGSSREAALLLAEAEEGTKGAIPEPVVHKPLGGEDAPETADDPSIANEKLPDEPGAAWRKKGLIIMTISVALIAGALAFSGVLDHPPTETVEGPQMEAVSAPSAAAARNFMTLLDAGDAEASYAAASEAFRDQYSFNRWEFGAVLHSTNGGAQSRDLVSVEREPDPAGTVHKELEILTFDTVMMNGKERSERVVMTRVGDGWQVANIAIEDREDK